MVFSPKTQHAKRGNLHIAHQVTERGPLDLVWIPGFVSHLESTWEHPWPRPFLERLTVEECGGHTLNCVPGEWRLFAVSSAGR